MDCSTIEEGELRIFFYINIKKNDLFEFINLL